MNTFFKDSANRAKQQAENEVFQLVLPRCGLYSGKIVQTERSGKRKMKFSDLSVEVCHRLMCEVGDANYSRSFIDLRKKLCTFAA